MLQDIEQHIDLIEKSIAWAREFNKDSFPYDNSSLEISLTLMPLLLQI